MLSLMNFWQILFVETLVYRQNFRYKNQINKWKKYDGAWVLPMGVPYVIL